MKAPVPAHKVGISYDFLTHVCVHAHSEDSRTSQAGDSPSLSTSPCRKYVLDYCIGAVEACVCTIGTGQPMREGTSSETLSESRAHVGAQGRSQLTLLCRKLRSTCAGSAASVAMGVPALQLAEAPGSLLWTSSETGRSWPLENRTQQRSS